MSDRLSSLKLKKSPKKIIRKTTPIKKEKKNESEEGPSDDSRDLIATKRDFFLLSLSISLGLLIFVIFVFLIYKLYNFLFGSGEETENEDLGFLDELEEVEKNVEEEEEIEEELTEIDKGILDGEDMEEVV